MSDYPDKQKYNRCLKDIGILLQQTSNQFQLMEREQKKMNGFTSSQTFLLTELIDTGRLSMIEVSRQMNLEKSSVSRMVDILVRDGFLEKGGDKEDKRITYITLTEKGLKEALDLRENRLDYYRRIISSLPSGHVREVMNSVEILLNAIKKAV